MNCFWTLSSVLRALSTSDLVVGSRSGTLMEKDTFGSLSLSLIWMPHSTFFLVETEVVSDMGWRASS